MGRSKLEYTTVKKEIMALGNYELLTHTYEGSSHKLDIKCLTCGHIMSKTFPDFKKNQCAPCGRARANQKKRTPIQDVRDYIASQGDVLKSTIYVNERDPLTVQCGKCLHDYTVTFINFKHHGGRCSCQYEREYHTFETVSEYIEKRGDKLKSLTYHTIHDPLNIECGKCANTFSMTYHYYYDQNRRCSCYTQNANTQTSTSSNSSNSSNSSTPTTKIYPVITKKP